MNYQIFTFWILICLIRHHCSLFGKQQKKLIWNFTFNIEAGT